MADHTKKDAVGHRQKMLINVLLGGFVKNYTNHYWEDKSPDENRGREALVELLRSERPLTRDLRDTLAALFDPKENHYPGGERRLLFELRGVGNRKETILHSSVAQHIYEAAKGGAGVKAGIDSAIDEFGLQERNVWRIWKLYRPTLEYVYGPLPAPRRGRKSR
jgi:hypothetical protein